MPSAKKLESTALAGLMIQIVFVAITFVLHHVSRQPGEPGSAALRAQMWFLVPGVALWLVVLMHGRHRRLARQEREEMEELKRTRTSEELFEEQELDRMRAHTGLVLFERYAVPAVSVLLAGALMFLAYRNMADTWAVEAPPVVPNPELVAIVMLLLTFFGFLIGKYACGLARSAEMRILHAAGAYLVGSVAASFLVVVAMATAAFEIMWVKTAVAYVISGLMGLIGVEFIANLILDIYRPRVAGREARPPYDSRLLGLIAEPGSVLRTLASTLDYQFGFKVSETWFYRFMERAIIPLFAVQVLALWLLSGIAVVDPEDVVFIDRFGRPRLSAQDREAGLKASVYGAGYHLKWPWPIEVARYLPAYHVISLELGEADYEEGEWRASIGAEKDVKLMSHSNVILWSETHVADPTKSYEMNFLVPSTSQAEPKPPEGQEPGQADAADKTPPANIVRLEAHVQYRIKTDPQTHAVDKRAAYQFEYLHADPRRLIENVSYSVLCRLAASQNFLQWIHVDRERVSHEFWRNVQRELDRQQLGVEVVYAGIPMVHPPAETASAYGEVIKAVEQKESKIHEAEAQRSVILEQAAATAIQVTQNARIERYRLERLSKADAERFVIQLKAYLQAPDVYRYRKYYSALEEVLAGQKLAIVPKTDDIVMIIDLGKRPSSELLTELRVREGVQ